MVLLDVSLTNEGNHYNVEEVGMTILLKVSKYPFKVVM